MNKQLKVLTRAVFGMFIVLFFAVTMIQFVSADELRANSLNQRSMKNSYKIERGAILVSGDPIAYSTPTDDVYRFTRQYSAGEMYAPVTGYFSRQQGMTGLEQAMNDDLSGLGNSQFFTRIMRTITGESPQGSSVETTLNAAAQEAAMDAMAGYSGAAVAIEPGTGRVLAMVSTPSFDPSLLSSNSDTEIITNYTHLEQDPARPLINRAIAGDLYHPGSTYKLLVAATAIENGTATPESLFDNPAELSLPLSTAVMRNASRSTCGPGEQVSLEQALVLSCNIPIAELAMSMDRDAVPEMAKAFGFEQELSIPLTVTPSVSPAPIDQAQTAITSIGQLDVRATPLQMAMVSAGILNGGSVMTPRLVDRVIAPNLTTQREYEDVEFSRPISESTARTMQQLMEQVVGAPGGTARLAQIDGARVGGKTGTAENGNDASGEQLPFTLWFTGYAVKDGKQVAVAVVIENGGGEAHGFAGNSSVLPVQVGKQIMEAVLNQ